MKILKLVVIGLFLGNAAYSQINFNGDFSFYPTNCADPINTNPGSTREAAPIQKGCVAGRWYASHGTPEICRFSDETNNFAHMWTGKYNLGTNSPIRGEGLIYRCKYEKGQVHTLTFKLMTTTELDHVYIYLSNDVPVQNSIDFNVTGGSYNIPFVANKQLVFHKVNYSRLKSQGWETFTLSFIPDQNYESIWIYPEDNNVDRQLLFLDDFQFSNCIPSLTYDNQATVPALAQVSNYILGRSVTISSGQISTLRAANYISLEPGFYANNGALLTAEIQGCGEYNPSKCCNDQLSFLTTSDGNASGRLFSLNPYTYCTPPQYAFVQGDAGQADTEKENNAEISVFPNPAVENVQIKYSLKYSQTISINVYGSNGNLIESVVNNVLSESGESKIPLNLKTYLPGMYLCTLILSNNEKITAKFIVK